KVEGEEKGDSHGGKDGQFDPSKVPFKRWEDWERNRLRKLRRQERQRQLVPGAPYSNEQNESNSSLLLINDPYDSSSVVSRGSTNDIGQQHHFYDYTHTHSRQRPEFSQRHSQVENLRLINDGSNTSIDSYDTNNTNNGDGRYY
ncbi:9369_t:CDS:1, partial [Gigaspora margarita]